MDPVLDKSSGSKSVVMMDNLHPALPLDTRIAVVGGGPSGLAAALALTKLGYENVIVLEREATVGGMCASAVIEGRAYDLGGQVLARDSSPTMRSLMSEMGTEMEDMSDHTLAEIDCGDGNYKDLNVAADYMSIMSITLKLQNEAAATGRFGVHALSDIASQPADEFLRARGFPNGVPTAVANGFTASGYGYPSDMPYAYIHEFSRTSMLGKIWRVKGGYSSFWEKAASTLPDVRCGVQVTSINRSGDKIHVSITTSNDSTESELQFDKVIMTGSSFLPSTISSESTESDGILDYAEEERQLLSRVRTIEYYTTALRISGLGLPVGFYYPKIYKDDSKSIGHPVAIQRFFADSDVFLFWSYGNAEIDQRKMTHLLFEDVQRMGGHVDEFILQRKWKYFPHVSSKEMADGFYDRMSELQGKNNTYYLGALLAFELTERNVFYAFELVKKHFGTTNEHPYVKKLMPRVPAQIKSNYDLKELGELPGVEFPQDLPSVDAYLSYYARHKVLGNRVLYTWIDDQGKEADTRTYGELDVRAGLVAHGLRFNGKASVQAGDRVILLHPPGLDFIEAFFGCIRARVIPVPLIPPDPTKRAGQALSKVANVAKACDAKAILSTYAYHAAVRAASIKNILTVSTKKKSAPDWPDLPWHHTDSWTKRGTINPWNWFSGSNGSSATSACLSASTVDLENESLLQSPNSSSEASNSSSSSNIRNHGRERRDKELKGKLAQNVDFWPPPAPSDLCFLQFTSGSTGDSKGVMISHGGLLHNVKLMRSQYRSTSQTVLVSWLPQYHDMGLIGGLFTAMLSGGVAILFSPTTFIRKPLLWLETMAKYKCTHSAGPNFAFELIVKRLETLQATSAGAPTYDFSSLRFLMISAEPVRYKTVQSFVELLRGAGLQEQALAPGYGLAENCVFVCVAYGKGLPVLIDWQGRVCCGYAERGNKDVDIRIVDPISLEELAAGCEGEIWVSSPSMGTGYWGQKELGDQTFSNTIRLTTGAADDRQEVEEGNSKRFLRTGDLGRVIDNKLFVTGRIKDLIIVRGRNLYPADIEKTVENCSDSLRPGCCAVFSASQNVLQDKGVFVGDAGVVVVAEVRDEKKINSELPARIMSTVAEEYGVQVAYVNFIKPRTIPKTTSGKIRRIECLKRFADNKLESVKAPRALRRWVSAPNRAASSIYSPVNSPRLLPKSPRVTCKSTLSKREISDFLVGVVAERTGLPAQRISELEPLANYNIDSVGIVWAAQKLSDFLKVHVAPIDIYTAGTIAELTDVVHKKHLPQSITVVASRTPISPTSTQHPDKAAITSFVVGLVAEKTGLPIEEISLTQNLLAYNIDSVGVVWAAQKLSDYLGVHVPAIDIYTAGCITELVNSATTSMLKVQPSLQLEDPEMVTESSDHDQEGETLTEEELLYSEDPSLTRRAAVSSLQALGVLYIGALLLFPAALMFNQVTTIAEVHLQPTFGGLILSMILIPLAWIIYIGSIPVIISLLGSSLLQPNFTFAPVIPLWSARYAKWWTLFRLQEFASSMVAVHLRGTVFLQWWYRLLGAHIGEGVQLESTDITDPCLLYLGNGVVIGEGATVLCHEVKGGIVYFRPVKINNEAQVGPFSVIQRGTVIDAGASLGALSKTDVGQRLVSTTPNDVMPFKGQNSKAFPSAAWQLMGLYLVGMVSATAALVAYVLLLWFVAKFEITGQVDVQNNASIVGFVAFALSATFPWAMSGVAPVMAFQPSGILLHLLLEVIERRKVIVLLISLGGSYVAYGSTLAVLTIALKWCLQVGKGHTNTSPQFRVWFVHALLRFTHHKFVSLLSGTEAASIYLRCLGSKIGARASIRRVNALVEPDVITLGEGCHIGDFANIITSESGSSSSSRVHVGANCVVGAQSVIMPGAVLEDEAMLGAMSVANKTVPLKSGCVYVGVDSPVCVLNNSKQSIPGGGDYRINQMDSLYQKIVANLSASIGKTTVSVNARYFHRMGVGGKGVLRFFDDIPGLPQHDIFAPGSCFPVVLRHSNSLSGDDDARVDARGASIRVLRPNCSQKSLVDDALLDLTLKTGRGFYARNILEFVSWLTKNHAARVEHVKKFPHTAKQIWDSLKSCDSYTQMHYFSNVARLFQSTSGTSYYVKFKLRPVDSRFGEDSGRVEPTDRIPPETGAIPRASWDERPPHYLKQDFIDRVASAEGVMYIFQMQFRPKSQFVEKNEEALDCTKAWDETLSPYIDVAELHLTEKLDERITESIRFNPRNGPSTLPMVDATSAFESASIDHGRSLAYDIAQYLRNGMPLPTDWQSLLKKADSSPFEDTGNLKGCPAMSGAGTLPHNVRLVSAPAGHPLRPAATGKSDENLSSKSNSRPWVLLLTMIRYIQPLLQTMIPFVGLALASLPSVLALTFVGSKAGRNWMQALLPLGFMFSGLLLAALTVLARWMLVGQTREGDTSELWGWKSVCDTTWQSMNVVLSSTFMDLSKGSLLLTWYLRGLGASIDSSAYLDTLYALNPDLLSIGAGSSVGHNALLFGHLYEGGKVGFKSINIGDHATVGARSLLLPGFRMQDGSQIGALALGMKDEVVVAY